MSIWQADISQISSKWLLFSAHISYGKGKYLNQTVFFTKFAKKYCLRNMKKYIHRIQLTSI